MTLHIVTGTDTGVGKTFVSAALVAELRRRNVDAVALKPVETGWDEPASDARVLAVSSGQSVDDTVWAHYALPAAPSVAAAAESRSLDVPDLLRWLRARAAAHTLSFVEGAGGWMVPFTSTHLFSDIAAALVPQSVLLVAASRLGTINHTLLSAAAIQTNHALAAIALSVRPADSRKEAEMHRTEIAQRVDAPVYLLPRDLPLLADVFHVER